MNNEAIAALSAAVETLSENVNKCVRLIQCLTRNTSEAPTPKKPKLTSAQRRAQERKNAIGKIQGFWSRPVKLCHAEPSDAVFLVGCDGRTDYERVYKVRGVARRITPTFGPVHALHVSLLPQLRSTFMPPHDAIIDTGKVRIVFNEHQALTASAVAMASNTFLPGGVRCGR